MTMHTSDAALVAGHLAGEPGALAGIYDRFADSLHDTAAAMLNDRNEAADVLHDVILIAAERMGQLRDPERLKPWLFAILRNEVYRRTKQRRQTIATDFSGSDDGHDVADDRHLEPSPDPSTRVADEAAGDDLAELVRNAARGLDDRDQLVLELSVRQGLGGQDLADALGVSTNQSYTLVHRMRERVERSLTAFVVAKAGRNDCDDLDQLLATWDGEFTVLVRKRVARHVDACTVCDTRRSKVAPLAMFAAAPVYAAPDDLRDRILDAARAKGPPPSTPYKFTASDGFPQVVRIARRVAAWVAPAAAASLILVAGGLGVVFADRGNDDALRDEAFVSVTTEAVEASTSTVAPSTSTGATNDSVRSISTTSTTRPTTTAVTSTVVGSVPAVVPPAPKPVPTVRPTVASTAPPATAPPTPRPTPPA
ncbi:MAG: sigma-70 family RNA polymerase sigma factor, partial [Ilumatobacter sp.]|uniref:RNA polymerase sigma factor n=1 Tax=Ilumatobacter sp. TaxID=1967498 RepID=UPI003C70EC1B